MPGHGESVLLCDSDKPVFVRRRDLNGFSAFFADKVMMVISGHACSEELPTRHRDRVCFACLDESVESSIHGGQADC